MIADEGTETRDEGSGGQVDVANDVQWETIESEDDGEECQIRSEFEEV